MGVAKSSLSTEWQVERQSLKRLLKHFNGTALAGCGLSALLMMFYVIVDAISQDNYDCSRWSINAAPLCGISSSTQWVFIGFACIFYVFVMYSYGLLSLFARDKHSHSAERIHAGLQVITHHWKHHLAEFKVSSVYSYLLVAE